MSELHHATCIVLKECGIMLRGPSGSGKSDLAYRMIAHHGAELVSDDQTFVTSGVSGGEASPFGSAPDKLAGLIELRGLGLLHLPHVARARLHLVVELVPRDDVPRMPDPAVFRLCGHDLPLIALHAFDATVGDKLGLAARSIPKRGFPGVDGILHQPG